MTAVTKLATVQKRGQVTIPIELRRKFGIEEGGVVAILETSQGILISPREVLDARALARIREALNGHGLRLEELLPQQWRTEEETQG